MTSVVRKSGPTVIDTFRVLKTTESFPSDTNTYQVFMTLVVRKSGDPHTVEL